MDVALMDPVERLRTALADRYEIDREIGRGGMACVYRARDRQHDRLVAIKVLRPELAVSVGADRFLREIRIAAGLQHPNILPLHDSGSADGILYYVMPLVEGESLQQRIRRERQLGLPDALGITREVADALGYAHAHGIVHRDIKPANILLAGGHAIVADFGIACALAGAGDEVLTDSGLMVGTPEYMSPEQGSGDHLLDGRSDIYALGCVLYEMLVGDPPFTGRSAQSVIARHRLDPPPSLRVVRPLVSAALEATVQRALAKVAADRFATAAEFAAALNAPPAEPAPPVAVPPEPGRPGPRWRRLAGLAAIVVAAVAALLVVSREGQRRDAAPGATSWIVIADFEGPANDHTLPIAVRELVTAELDQSRVIAPMPRPQIAGAMRDAGLPDTMALTAGLARELAVRSSVRTVLTGSVLPVAAGRYSIVLRVTDADSGRTLLSVTRAASDRDLIPVVQDAGREIRERLGERRNAIAANKPLVQVATPSFEAYRKYVDAVALSEQGEVVASNRLLREAVALDTGFAAAWVTIATNYQTMRNLDSAGLAVAEALRRPTRLSDAQRYRLQADAAYALHYDIPAAVRWYDLLLQIAPRSISGHNNRGLLLYSMGRYQEALAEFRQTEALEPFGVTQAQIEIFNQAVTLLSLGREAEAADVATKLRGEFATYAAELLATYRGRWSVAESLATRPAVDPSAPPWARTAAITILSGARAARGAVASADHQLRLAAESADGSGRPWFCHALLMLAVASERPPGPVPPWLLADTTAGGIVAAGLWAAVAGDLETARARLGVLQQRPAIQQRRLGYGPALIGGYSLAAAGRWRDVVGRLRDAALAGERDAGDLDQVSGFAVRWLVAQAYEHLGKPDSAAAMYEMVVAPAGVPFSHLALRGLVHPFASRRLALLYGAIGRPDAAARQWQIFRSEFVTPDREQLPKLAQPR